MSVIYERQFDSSLSIKKFSEKWGVNLKSKTHRVEYYAPHDWHESITERLQWLRSNIMGEVYITHNCNTRRKVYCFQLKEDAMLFKLTWC